MDNQPLKGLHFAIVQDPNYYYENLKKILEMNGANVKFLMKSRSKKSQLKDSKNNRIDIICRIKYKSE